MPKMTEGLRQWAKGNKWKSAFYMGVLALAGTALLMMGKPEQADTVYQEQREFSQTLQKPDGTTTTSTTTTTITSPTGE